MNSEEKFLKLSKVFLIDAVDGKNEILKFPEITIVKDHITLSIQKPINTSLFFLQDGLHCIGKNGFLYKMQIWKPDGGTDQEEDQATGRTEHWTIKINPIFQKDCKTPILIDHLVYAFFTEAALAKYVNKTLLADFQKMQEEVKTNSQQEIITSATPTTKNIVERLTAGTSGEKIERLQARTASHSQKRQFTENSKYLVYGYSSNGGKEDFKLWITTPLPEYDSGNYNSAKSLLHFCMDRMIESHSVYTPGNRLNNDTIEFDLQDLVDTGLYKTIRSARSGFDSGMQALKTLQVAVECANGKHYGKTQAVIFTTNTIIDNHCIVKLNQSFPCWNLLFGRLMALPKFYFLLSSKASALLYEIFYTAVRPNNKTSIKEQGYFTISMQTASESLFLPDAKSTKNPQRDIKGEVKKAVEEINQRHDDFYGGNELYLSICFKNGGNETQSISDYMKNGYLKVEMKPDALKRYIETEKQYLKIDE